MPRAACAMSWRRRQKRRPRKRRMNAAWSCWQGQQCCAGALRDLPDPDGLLLASLPSRATEGGESGISQSAGLAICRRLVAVHCLYGVDSNRLAIELAKVSLWLESYAEGLPLDIPRSSAGAWRSVLGPFFVSMMTLPVGGGELDPLLAHGVQPANWSACCALHCATCDALQATVGSRRRGPGTEVGSEMSIGRSAAAAASVGACLGRRGRFGNARCG